MDAFFVCLLILGTLFNISNGEISQENQDIIRKWMPLYWLHSEEVFNPTNFDYYISQMQVRDENGNVIDPNPTAETLITGDASKNLHLNTVEDIDCVHCYDEAFFGMPVDQLKPFAIAKVYNDECNTIDVGFNTWYPYNYGKDVCFSVDPNGFCLVPRITFGNHFCDGDSSHMRIQNGQPKLLQVNVHTFGALYGYNNETGIFDFISGETIEVTDGLDFEVDYPKQVLTVDGHPELFVSNGSHGNWGAPGRHKYLQFFIHLDDYTDRGTPWPFYEQAEIIDYADASGPIEALRPELQFRKFQGNFGNIDEVGCEITEPLFGVCQISRCGGQPFGGDPTYSLPSPPVCNQR